MIAIHSMPQRPEEDPRKHAVALCWDDLVGGVDYGFAISHQVSKSLPAKSLAKE